MPKRCCPFEDNRFLLKMHVRQKEIDLGVKSDENMNRVFEVTRKMLFDGATKGCHVTQSKESKLSNGNNNVLSESLIPNSNGCANIKGKTDGLSPCCATNASTTCFFCDKTICVNCSRTCLGCQNVFCGLCSVLKYDSQYESAVCLSCR